MMSDPPETMAEQMQLRPATLEDANRLAHLWATTFPEKFGPILGEMAEAVLADWLRLSKRHLPTTTVAEIEGTVAGFIVLDTAAAPRPDDGRWLWQALQLHNGIFGALRGLMLMALLDSHHQRDADEAYIEMLGVAAGWRGRGIARALMTHAEAAARATGANRLTLEVVSDNRPAILLYKKQEFEISRQRRNIVLKWITGHPGYLEMTKVITAM